MSHYDDEAEVENLKRWWNENWKPLAAGLVLGLAGIFGWQAWQAHRNAEAMQASQMFDDIKKAVAAGQTSRAREVADKLAADYADTPYAAQGALALAGGEARDGAWDEAAKRLDWARDHARDDGLKAVAQLRRARVAWQQGKADDALKLLEKAPVKSFEALYRETEGDIRAAKGDRAGARTAYSAALTAGVAPAAREFVQQKLDDLADVAPAAEARPAAAPAKS